MRIRTLGILLFIVFIMISCAKRFTINENQIIEKYNNKIDLTAFIDYSNIEKQNNRYCYANFGEYTAAGDGRWVPTLRYNFKALANCFKSISEVGYDIKITPIITDIKATYSHNRRRALLNKKIINGCNTQAKISFKLTLSINIKNHSTFRFSEFASSIGKYEDTKTELQCAGRRPKKDREYYAYYNAIDDNLYKSLPKLIDKLFYSEDIQIAEHSIAKQKALSANNIIWSAYYSNNKNITTNKSSAAQNPFKAVNQSIQNKVDNYLLPRRAINIKSKIPGIIQKPKLPPVPKLVKSQFETKADFEKRVQGVMATRQNTIENLQKKYRKDVENRNITISNLKAAYENDILKIKDEQKKKKEDLPKHIIAFSKISFAEIFGKPMIEKISYDAETETMYCNLLSNKAVYKKKIKVNVAKNNAEDFFKNIKSVFPIVVFSIDNNSINLKEISLIYKRKEYIAQLTEKEFTPEKIEVAIVDKKVNFDSATQSKLNLQNPNLIDKFRVSAFEYKESSAITGIKYHDDIFPLVKQLKAQNKDPKKWLFIIAVEDYNETDPVIYAKNSAMVFKEVAQKIFGVSDRNTYDLINDKATSGAIEDNLSRLLSNVNNGDVIYFYYSGHGVPDPKTGDSYILPKDKVVDFISKENEFKLSNIYNKLSKSRAAKVIAFIDACFSGKTDDIPIFKGVAPGLIKTKKVTFDKQKMVVLTAGKNNQFSNSFDEKGHRMFSYYLIKSLTNAKKINLENLYKEVSLNVYKSSNAKGDAYLQEPQIYGNTELSLW